MQKYLHLSKKTWFIGIAVALLVFLFAMGAHSWFFSHRDEQYHFGKIIEITGGTFVIEDKEQRREIIHVSPDTSIKEGMGKEPGLRVGEEVIVSGHLNDAGEIEATVIRILNDHK